MDLVSVFIAGFATASFVWFNALAPISNRLGGKINTRSHLGEPHLRYRDHSLRPKIAQHPGAAISERGGEIPDTEESGTTAPRTTISTAMSWKTAVSSCRDTTRQLVGTVAKGWNKP